MYVIHVSSLDTSQILHSCSRRYQILTFIDGSSAVFVWVSTDQKTTYIYDCLSDSFRKIQ